MPRLMCWRKFNAVPEHDGQLSVVHQIVLMSGIFPNNGRPLQNEYCIAYQQSSFAKEMSITVDRIKATNFLPFHFTGKDASIPTIESTPRTQHSKT